MRAKSIGPCFGLILLAGATASAQGPTPVQQLPSGLSLPSAVPIDPLQLGRRLTPLTANEAPQSSEPAASGVRPVRMSVVQALQARAHLPQSVPVPPTQEIEVLDPNVDPMGRPTVRVNPVIGPDGVARVDIPPTVLVHRFYYTGDRSFQGPMLPGGPSIIVVNHPADGERLYLEVQMLPGAPRVIYTRHEIEYNYGVQSIILSFGAHGRPKISYRQGVSLATQVRVAGAQVRQSTVRLVERTGAPAAARMVLQGTKNVAETGADHVHDIGKAVITPVVKIVQMIPGVKMLTSSVEDRVQHERDNLVQQATLLNQAQAEVPNFEGSIPTNRGQAASLLPR
jgi:hypothetical protein